MYITAKSEENICAAMTTGISEGAAGEAKVLCRFVAAGGKGGGRGLQGGEGRHF